MSQKRKTSKDAKIFVAETQKRQRREMNFLKYFLKIKNGRRIGGRFFVSYFLLFFIL